MKKGRETFAKKKQIDTSNLDIFTYVNSKFVYVEKHIRTQMKNLYADIIKQKYKLEQQTTRNSLSLAIVAPDQFAYDVMNNPGYMSLVAGEVVHIIKCTPVEVKVQHEENCLMKLQVTRNNKTFFLSLYTKLTKIGIKSYHYQWKLEHQSSCNHLKLTIGIT